MSEFDPRDILGSDVEAITDPELVEALARARAEYAIPDRLRHTLSPEEAEAHHLLSLAFDIRFPASRTGGMSLDSGVSLGRMRDFYPEPTRHLSEVVRDEKTGETRYQHYNFTRDGVLVPWRSPGVEDRSVSSELAKQLAGKVLKGYEIDSHYADDKHLQPGTIIRIV